MSEKIVYISASAAPHYPNNRTDRHISSQRSLTILCGTDNRNITLAVFQLALLGNCVCAMAGRGKRRPCSRSQASHIAWPSCWKIDGVQLRVFTIVEQRPGDIAS